MALVSGAPDRVAPTEFAQLPEGPRRGGAHGPSATNSSCECRDPGTARCAWSTSSPTSFRLATLAGHLEAGQIEFTARPRRGSPSSSDIESWARSGDRFSDLLYDRVRMAKEIQLHMWTSLLERVARVAAGRITGGIDIETRRVDDAAPR